MIGLFVAAGAVILYVLAGYPLLLAALARLPGSSAARGVELLRVAAALNAAMKRATGELLLLTDVRQPLAPATLRNLVSCFGDPSVGAVSGHIVFSVPRDQIPPHEGLYWRYEKWIRRNLTRLDSLLVATGCIFAMRRRLFVPLPAGSLVDDAFLPLTVVVQGYRVVYEPEAVAYECPAPLKTEFWRKVRTLAGLYQLVRSHPRLLGPANRLWIHFASYKLGRLLLPWALLTVAVTTPALSSPGRVARGQLSGYGLAAAHPWIPGPPLRISSVARTFVVLMAASLCDTSVLFVPPASLWKKRSVPKDGEIDSAVD